MIDLASDIQSLSHFKRNSANLMAKLKRSKRPMVLTVNGRARIVVQDAASYQELLRQAERSEMIEFLKQSKADADAGRTVDADEFFRKLDGKL